MEEEFEYKVFVLLALARVVYDVLVDGFPMEGFPTRFQEILLYR